MSSKYKHKNEIKTLSLRWFYSEMIKLGGGLGLYLYLRPRLYRVSEGTPKRISGGVLIAANHRSQRDPLILFLVFWYRRLYFPATSELFEKPMNRFFFHNMNCIRIDRSENNVQALKTMCGWLKKNRAVAIFPEGAINTTEKLLNFKKGTAYMANKSGRPVVPVYIGDREKWWQCIPVIVGEPVDVKALCRSLPRGEALDRASEYLRDEELRLKNYYDSVVRPKQSKRCI